MSEVLFIRHRDNSKTTASHHWKAHPSWLMKAATSDIFAQLTDLSTFWAFPLPAIGLVRVSYPRLLFTPFCTFIREGSRRIFHFSVLPDMWPFCLPHESKLSLTPVFQFKGKCYTTTLYLQSCAVYEKSWECHISLSFLKIL